MLADEIKAWLREHKNAITLGASYDGIGSMQSTNRGTDKYNLDLAFFREVWSHQPLHMTISKDTLLMLVEGVLDVQEIAFKIGSTADAITLKDFTATTFTFNGMDYKISGSSLVKK